MMSDVVHVDDNDKGGATSNDEKPAPNFKRCRYEVPDDVAFKNAVETFVIRMMW